MAILIKVLPMSYLSYHSPSNCCCLCGGGSPCLFLRLPLPYKAPQGGADKGSAQMNVLILLSYIQSYILCTPHVSQQLGPIRFSHLMYWAPIGCIIFRYKKRSCRNWRFGGSLPWSVTPLNQGQFTTSPPPDCRNIPENEICLQNSRTESPERIGKGCDRKRIGEYD